MTDKPTCTDRSDRYLYYIARKRPLSLPINRQSRQTRQCVSKEDAPRESMENVSGDTA